MGVLASLAIICTVVVGLMGAIVWLLTVDGRVAVRTRSPFPLQDHIATPAGRATAAAAAAAASLSDSPSAAHSSKPQEEYHPQGRPAAAFREPEVAAAAIATVDGLTDLQINWLRRCLPVFVQPTHDVKNGNGLLGTSVTFVGDECRVSHGYAGEASYAKFAARHLNFIATLFYRTFNFLKFKRTVDVNDLVFTGVNLDPQAEQPWKSIASIDFAGSQTWSTGAKASYFGVISLVHHYVDDLPFEMWQIYRPEDQGMKQGDTLQGPIALAALDQQLTRPPEHPPFTCNKWFAPGKGWEESHSDGYPTGSGYMQAPGAKKDWRDQKKHLEAEMAEVNARNARLLCGVSARPVVFLNTMNHLIGCEDNNPHMLKTYWTAYPVRVSSREDIEKFILAYAPVRFNFATAWTRSWRKVLQRNQQMSAEVVVAEVERLKRAGVSGRVPVFYEEIGMQ